MATGDSNDIVARLKAALPRGWFAGNTPLLDALLTGLAAVWVDMYALLGYVQQQTRIATASGVWLDIISADFFGTGLPRLPNEFDAQYRARIRAALLVEKGTRSAMYLTLLRLTGRAPWIFEPARPADTGGYSGAGGVPMGLAYGYAGRYGSLQMAYQALVVAYLPSTAGIPNVGGYGLANYNSGQVYIGGSMFPQQLLGGPGGYGVASRLEYSSLANSQETLALAAIYSAVDSAKPAGTLVWVGTSN